MTEYYWLEDVNLGNDGDAYQTDHKSVGHRAISCRRVGSPAFFLDKLSLCHNRFMVMKDDDAGVARRWEETG